MSAFLRVMILLVTTMTASTHGAEPVRLVENGKSSHVIILESDASESEEFAAEELRSHFEACTGVRLPLVRKEPEAQTPMIVLGSGPLARSLGVDPSDEELGDQGYRLETVGQNVVIAGTAKVGTLYGVHRFLEETLGVRWYTPEFTKTPKVKNLEIPPVAKTVRPAIRYRFGSYHKLAKDPDFLARVGFNYYYGGRDRMDRRRGFHVSEGGVHRYFRYVDPREFFDTHPEYFSELGGKRRRAQTQLCLTNPDVLDITTRKMLKRFEESPDLMHLNFGAMDWLNPCECPKCRAMNERYGSLGGTHHWFVNQLAERIAKVYPNKRICSLAYRHTEEPPKGMKIHPNVTVLLCHMFPSCDAHSINDCPREEAFKNRVIAWSEISDSVFIWHYCVNFFHYYMPFPNFHSLAENLRFYAENGVKGVYFQGGGHRGGGGEWSLLRPHYMMKLAWDPDQDPDQILKEFLQDYYQAAAEPLYQYIRLLQDKVADDNIHMHLYTNPGQGYLPDDVIAKAEKLFDDAEAAVNDSPEILERVRVARMPLVYARLFPRNGYKIENGRLVFPGEHASEQEIADFIARMRRHGFQQVAEAHLRPSDLEVFAKVFKKGLDVVTLENDSLRVDIVPFLGGRALRIVDRRTGQCVTAQNNIAELHFPFSGGLFGHIGELWRSWGWKEPAKVVERDGNRVVLEIAARGWGRDRSRIILRRVYELDPDQPVLHAKSVLENPSDRPTTQRLRSTLQLDLGTLSESSLCFTNREGERTERTMADILPNLLMGEYFRKGRAPDGSWTFTGTKGLSVTQRFKNAQVDHGWVWSYPEDLGQIEVELWGQPQEIPGHGKAVFEETIEVRPAK